MDFLVELSTRLAVNLQRAADDSELTEEQLDYMITLAERLLNGFALLMSAVDTLQLQQQTLQISIACLQDVIETLYAISTHISRRQSGFYTPIEFHGTQGRPTLDLTADLLEYFFDHGFSATQTAQLLHVSLSTVRRRMSEFGLAIRRRYSTMTDAELDRIIAGILSQHPHYGYRMMHGQLASLGHCVQQNRVRQAMVRVDPEGVLSRWHCSIQRRSYYVPTPNSLWHIDGYHRLIRFALNYRYY